MIVARSADQPVVAALRAIEQLFAIAVHLRGGALRNDRVVTADGKTAERVGVAIQLGGRLRRAWSHDGIVAALALVRDRLRVAISDRQRARKRGHSVVSTDGSAADRIGIARRSARRGNGIVAALRPVGHDMRVADRRGTGAERPTTGCRDRIVAAPSAPGECFCVTVERSCGGLTVDVVVTALGVTGDCEGIADDHGEHGIRRIGRERVVSADRVTEQNVRIAYERPVLRPGWTWRDGQQQRLIARMNAASEGAGCIAVCDRFQCHGRASSVWWCGRSNDGLRLAKDAHVPRVTAHKSRGVKTQGLRLRSDTRS